MLGQTIAVPASGQEAWPWVAALIASALVFVFIKWNGAQEARIARAEKAQDALLEDNRKSASVLAEQSAAILKAAEVAGNAVEMAKQTNAKLDSLARLVEDNSHKAPTPRRSERP